jgi:hypothetical protein
MVIFSGSVYKVYVLLPVGLAHMKVWTLTKYGVCTTGQCPGWQINTPFVQYLKAGLLQTMVKLTKFLNKGILCHKMVKGR